MKFLLLLPLLYTLLSATQDDAKALYLANINALMIFTSQDNVGSGKYNFTNINTHMIVLHAPFRYHFPSKKSDSNFFISGSGGYSQTEGELTLPTPQTKTKEGEEYLDFRPVLSTYTGGLGLGWRYRITPHSSILLGGEFIYSRVGVVLRAKEAGGFDFIPDFFKETFNDNLSFKGLLEYTYTRKVHKYIIDSKLGFRYFNTSSTLDLKEIISTVYEINSQSYLTQLRFGVESPPLFTLYRWPLTVKLFTEGDLLLGDVSTILKVDSYAQVGTEFSLYTIKQNWGITRFYLSGSALKGYGINGYNIGLGLSVGF